MISLKKHIDSLTGRTVQPALAAYRSLLLTLAERSHRAVPGLGKDLERKLLILDESLASSDALEVIARTAEKAETEISQWAEQAFQRHTDAERELKEIIGVIAKAMESVSERDQRYAREVGNLTERLRSITSLSDLTALRRSIVESAGELTECVERITRDGRESLHRLAAEVEEYRTRLDKSEKLSSLDPLTGLANRRRFEEQLDVRIRAGGVFSLILLDLNDFKAVNDQFGHLAGDELLKLFADELRMQFRLADLVARWGGDEFAVIVNSTRNDVTARMHGLRRSVFGEYKIKAGQRMVTVMVDASIGVAQWIDKESGRDLMARADHSMYTGKSGVKPRGPEEPGLRSMTAEG